MIWSAIQKQAVINDLTAAKDAIMTHGVGEMTPCDHLWQPGDVYSDFICCHCGERADLEVQDPYIGRERGS